ncbi:MAG: hypothetical protein A2X94_03535 [Bdellovibrionales bacterium GWB1_55_8]|nr:MAG: hypothetical protein A2X94_03535 [Bdellovibrionales bacterium GWB1_55_8]
MRHICHNKAAMDWLFKRMPHHVAFLVLAIVLFSTGCASRYQVMSDYRDLIRDNHPDRVNRSTTVLFLVDGLSHAVLSREITRNPRGNLATYFQTAPAGTIPSAFTLFPSETYPGITTLLTGLPVDEHGVSGNRMLIDGRQVDFERPQPAKELEAQLWDKTVFARLAKENRVGVSLSYNFTTQASAALGPDIRAGIAYARERYDRVDERTLRSLEILLNRAGTHHWPDFVFVHLVGLDAVSHNLGPDSSEASRYLRWLDGALAPTFMRLQLAESEGHSVRTILTADHGFEPITTSIDLRTAARFYLRKFDDYFTPVVAPRYAALHLKTPLASVALRSVLRPLSKLPLFDGIAIRDGDGIRYESRKVRLEIAIRSGSCASSNYEIYAFDLLNAKAITGNFVCPETLEYDNRGKMERIIASQLAAYFHAKGAPEAVIFAAAGVSFVKDGAGQHGGLSVREMEVPLLIRNARYVTHRGSALPLRRVLSDITSVSGKGAGFSPAVIQEGSPTAIPVRRQLAFGTPSGMDWLRAEIDPSSEVKRWDSSVEPGISVEYLEKWSRNWGWLGQYQLSFAQFRAKNASLASDTASSTQRFTQHRFGFGPLYRFHDGLGFHVLLGAGQHFFAVPGEAQAAWVLSRRFIPQLSIGSPFRLLTLPIGDLQGLAEFTALFPQGSEAIASRTGYRESLMVSFDQSVRTWDVLSWFAGIEHERIPYRTGQMSQVSAKIGVGYRIVF